MDVKSRNEVKMNCRKSWKMNKHAPSNVCKVV